MSPGAIAVLVVLGVLVWAAFAALCYMLLIEIRSRLDLWRRARHDYRTARGTQHLRQIRKAQPALQRTLQAHRTKASDLQRQVERVESEYATTLHRALSQYLVEEHLTEVPGIGPTLGDRIVRHAFRDSLSDLHHAYRVQGIGPNLQHAISAWVDRYRGDFARLLAEPFPGKEVIAREYEEQLASLDGKLAKETETVERLEGLYRRVQEASTKLERIKPKHFRRALRRGPEDAAVPPWYLEGIYPAWEPMPEWFETLLNEYGG